MTKNGIYNIREVKKELWLQQICTFTDNNYRHSWEFSAAGAKRLNAVCEKVGIQRLGHGLVGLAAVRIKKLPILNGGIAYINGGPLVLQHGNFDNRIYSEIITTLKNEYVVKRRLSLRIAPPHLDSGIRSEVNNILLSKGFKDNNDGKKTIVLDLTKDAVQIRKDLHHKWRNCLNKAEKSNLIIRKGKDDSLFNEFIPLFNELIIKKNFNVDLGIDFYEDVHKHSTDSDKYIIMLAEFNGAPVAGYVGSFLGDTSVYLLGSANDVGRELNAAYLLQWEAILSAKEAGCCRYDLGGIDPQANPGVYRFKQRMCGREMDISGPYEARPTGVLPILTKLGERVYKLMKPYILRL